MPSDAEKGNTTRKIWPPRVPPPVRDIQINCCFNPECENFGKPVSLSVRHGRGKHSSDNYILKGSKNRINMKKKVLCKLCCRETTVKSNLATWEEYERISSYLNVKSRGALPVCSNPACVNHFAGTLSLKEWMGHFPKNGVNSNGSRRLRCKACGKTFSIGNNSGKAHGNHKKSYKNRLVFSLLVNKTPISRICEIAQITPSTAYRKIHFIREQCERFSGHRERRLIEGNVCPDEVRVSVDQQYHLVNWNQRKDKRNIQLYTITSADNISGYIFGSHTNFDPSIDTKDAEAMAKKVGDSERMGAYRRYARVWLEKDYEDSHAISVARKSQLKTECREESYETCETMSPGLRIPAKGVQVHAEYTAFAHFLLLKQMLSRVGRVDFYLDVEQILKRGCLYFFKDMIKTGKCDAFLVSINKDFSVDQKRKLIRATKKILNLEMSLHPSMSEWEVRRKIMKENIEKAFENPRLPGQKGKDREPWVTVPFPRMDEPQKQVLPLTSFSGLTQDQMIDTFLRAGLYGVDSFFQQIRRRVSLLERPISSSSSTGRKWFGYNPYNPSMIQDMVTIMRVFHNYVLESTNEKGVTPAMKLGLARGPVRIEDIIYFKG
ncbi:MAG: hypothetical protein Q7I97_01575 [Thermovirgaceae bacterium]|nr:hypothetical protein [Thermovirgaceae bacterium]